MLVNLVFSNDCKCCLSYNFLILLDKNWKACNWNIALNLHQKIQRYTGTTLCGSQLFACIHILHPILYYTILILVSPYLQSHLSFQVYQTCLKYYWWEYIFMVRTWLYTKIVNSFMKIPKLDSFAFLNFFIR